ncbi:MAG: Gx transporter family protein [Ruminococcaceae bacterium]|nr:Gx transporter family protein [Oscillospiraceae bacterium]
MSILSRGNRIRRITLDACLTALAMTLSYLELLLPLNLLIPLPGVRLGLANVVVLIAFCLVSKLDAAIISAVRILLMGLLFGTVTSLWFSFLGGLLSYLTLLLLSHIGRGFSFLAVSVLSAAAHNTGQILAATLLFEASVIFSYLPVLLLASVFFGGIVGLLLNLLLPRLKTAWKGGSI